MVKIIECPRDAMQGFPHQISTEKKISYLNQLLKVGFDTLDFGSFVSPKAVPQLADTAEVLAGLKLDETSTKLLAIVANLRGAQDACSHDAIHYLGYPFSISETFQLRNTRKTIAQSIEIVRDIQQLCQAHGKELVVYISMGFGNPYGDPWSAEIAADWVEQIVALGVRIISVADTVGTADVTTISPIFRLLRSRFRDIELGAHFHATPSGRREKLEAAWKGGVRRFDGALMGFGGCPFAEDELVGNIATETLFEFLNEKESLPEYDSWAFQQAMMMASQVFSEPIY